MEMKCRGACGEITRPLVLASSEIPIFTEVILNAIAGLPGSTDSSPPGSGSLTPQGDWRAVTPSSIYMRNNPLKDDLTIQGNLISNIS